MAFTNIIIVDEYTDAEGKIWRLTVPTDRGCRKSPHCLTCPLPKCIYEHSKEYNLAKYKQPENKMMKEQIHAKE